jgi:hypothetical protein
MPQAVRLGRSGGSGQRRSLRRISCRRYPGEHCRPYRLHYFRLARHPAGDAMRTGKRLTEIIGARPFQSRHSPDVG